MDIPNEILARFGISKQGETKNEDRPVEILPIKDASDSKKKSDKKSQLNKIASNKPKAKPVAHAKTFRKSKGSGIVLVARREISPEEWERLKKNAAKIGNPLSEKEAQERKKQRIALAEKYNRENPILGRSGKRKRKRYKPKTQKAKIFRKRANADDVNAVRSRNFGKGPSIRAAKQLRRTFSNIDDRQAMK